MLERSERSLLNRKVTLAIGNVRRIDPANRQIGMLDGVSFPYDFLVVATGAQIAPEQVLGRPNDARYDGQVLCFLETGRGQATQLVFDYTHPPQPPRPNQFYSLSEKESERGGAWGGPAALPKTPPAQMFT